MHRRLTKPDADESSNKNFYFNMHRQLKNYFWVTKESKLLLLAFLLYQTMVFLAILSEKDIIEVFQDEKTSKNIQKFSHYFKFLRLIGHVSPFVYRIVFYLVISIIFLLNIFLPLGFWVKIGIIKFINRKIIGKSYIWISVIGFFHMVDLILMPFQKDKELFCIEGSSSNPASCIDSSEKVVMRVIAGATTFWWICTALLILFMADNSRISKGRYFIRYSYEFEMTLLMIQLVSRVAHNILVNLPSQIKVLILFVMLIFLFLEIKWGDGIVHPTTKKYLLLFCILPIWFSMSQVIRVLAGKMMYDSLKAFSFAFLLFFPIYCFKVDELNLSLVTQQRNELIDDPRKMLVKLDTLLIILREENLDEKYSMLLEGVVREYQEYGTEDEELLNNFVLSEIHDKEYFFTKRKELILRVISLYFMKAISRFTDFEELKFSFVYFVFDFLKLQNQALEFLSEMQGHEMSGINFFKWIIVKTDIESEIMRKDEESKKEKSELSKANQKLKYDLLIIELEKNISMLIEFWKLVSEENTKVRTIRDSLDRLTLGLKLLDEFWEKDKKFFRTIPKCQFIYGLFLKDCVNQVNQGTQLIHSAYEQLEKQKVTHQNFKNVNLDSNLSDFEKGIAFVKILQKTTMSYIENCSVTFAKNLGSTKDMMIGATLSEFIPEEVFGSFLARLLDTQESIEPESKKTATEPISHFPFLQYRTRLMKELFFESRILRSSTNELYLVLNINLDSDFTSSSIMISNVDLNIRHMNSCFVGEYLEPENSTEILEIPDNIYLNQIFPPSILDPLREVLEDPHNRPLSNESAIDLFNDKDAFREIRFQENENVYIFYIIVLPDKYSFIKISNESTEKEKDTPDDATNALTNKFAPTGKPQPFRFSYNLTELKWVGYFQGSSAAHTPNMPTKDLKELLNNKGLSSSPFLLKTLGDFAQGQDKIVYDKGVRAMRLIKDNQIQEILDDDNNEDENDPEKESLFHLKSSSNMALTGGKTQKDSLKGEVRMDTNITRFSELKDPETMKKIIERLGKSNFYKAKIISICIKLIINITAGIVFYLLIDNLFTVLQYKLTFYNLLSLLGNNLMTSGYLNSEKLIYDKYPNMSVNQVVTNKQEFFFENDQVNKKILAKSENELSQVAKTLKKLNLQAANDIWYKDLSFNLEVYGESDKRHLSLKEGLSQLLSSGFAHFQKGTPEDDFDYYREDNIQLQFFIKNCLHGLPEAIGESLRKLHDSHTVFSTEKRRLLLALLLGKVGLGIIFVVTALILYVKETSKKERVISLYYGFLPNDIMEIIQTNQVILSSLINRGYNDSDSFIEFDKLEKETKGIKNDADDHEDEDSMRFMMAKRTKTKGKLDKFIDFNKSFIIFFAGINTAYFVFLYFWNISKYMEYWSLARLSKNNNDMALTSSLAFNKLSKSIYDTTPNHYHDNLDMEFEFYREKQSQLFVELLENKYSSDSTFDELFEIFFQDTCDRFFGDDERFLKICKIIMKGAIRQGYIVAISQFMKEVEIVSNYVEMVKNPNETIKAWYYKDPERCLKGPLPRDKYYDCIVGSTLFQDLRVIYKQFLIDMVTNLITRIGDFVNDGIKSARNVNLKFLTIILLLITVLLGISWILILVNDNRKFQRQKSFFSRISFDYIQNNKKMRDMIADQFFENK